VFTLKTLEELEKDRRGRIPKVDKPTANIPLIREYGRIL
jgi:hypothetical protein